MDFKDAVFVEEQAYLDNAVLAMQWEKEHHQNQLAILPRTYRDDPRLMQILMTLSATRLKRIEELKGKPYFARMDWCEQDARAIKLYIGKTAVADAEGRDVVIDWRAPVCSLYYDSNLGESSYTAPIGEILGLLLLKRQLLMEEGVLTEYFDVDSVSDDALLKPYLGANADNKLKTIVASIGKEQNQIIRWQFRHNLIVQGVAGSGKTTVALHRAAYLLYNEREKCKSSQFMVIGPNRYFISYISSVLPDLEADDIGQSIFEDIAIDFVGEKLKIAEGAISLDKVMEGKADITAQKVKTSLQYRKALNDFFEDFTKSLFPAPLEAFGMEILSKEQLRNIFGQHSIVPDLKSRISQTIIAASNQIKSEEESFLARLHTLYKPQMLASPKGAPLVALYDQLHKAQKEITSGCVKMLEKYFAPANCTVTALYKQFCTNMHRYLPTEIHPEAIGAATAKLLGKKIVSFEDTPAIIHLKLLLHGCGTYDRFVHILVDEAQDFGVFAFDCMKRLFANSSFTIVGDLAQGIYSYRSIEDWQQVVDKVFKPVGAGCDILYLEKSYRTTIEIMNCANLALKALGGAAAVPVIRSGDAPRLISLSKSKQYAHIQSQIAKFTATGLKSFAIITKTSTQAQETYNQLVALGVSCKMIEENAHIASSVTVLTGYQAKGLEFDFVFIMDVDTISYSQTSILDMRLLFVAMSRALHQMELLVLPDSIPALAGFLEL